MGEQASAVASAWAATRGNAASFRLLATSDCAQAATRQATYFGRHFCVSRQRG
jgi:hypothetical protein